jgi:thiamine-phosphate pyrophosphorylase
VKLVFVTPAAWDEKRLLAVAEEALEGGVDAVQLRRPGAAARDLFPLALLLRQLTDRAGALLIVNDRADIARAAGAGGVHLPRHSLPVAAARAVVGAGAKIGVSCHSVAEAAQAEAEGADYVFVGPVFETPSKPGRALGLAELARARQKVGLTLVGIGGVALENVGSVLAVGADGVAVISALADAHSPREAARALADAIHSWRGEGGPAVEL